MRKRLLGMLMVAMLMPVMSVNAGNGAGGGKDLPLCVESATIEDGEENVEIDREIKLVFAKNVNNMAVVDNNKTCFEIVDADGNSVLENVVTFDDQLDRDNRNNIVLEATLEEGNSYTITVDKNMMAKSGQTLGEEVVIQFATAGGVQGGSMSTIMLILCAAVIVIGVGGFVVAKKKKQK